MATIWIHNRKSSTMSEESIKKLPKLSKEEFTKLVNKKGNRVVTDDSFASSNTQKRRVTKLNLVSLQKLLEKDKEELNELISMPDDENPFEIIEKDGKERKVGLINKDTLIYDIIRNHFVCQSKLNKYRIYRIIYEGILENIPSTPEILESFRQLIKPSKARLLKTKLFDNELINIVSFCNKFEFKTKVEALNKPKKCADEEGTGLGGDSCGNITVLPSTIGILKNNDWALKNFNTCVRDQGGRGTCVAFGTTAAVESAIAVHYNRFVNLSEQDLYRHFKLDWYPTPTDYYGDGHNGLTALLNAVSNKYIFPFEKDWNYNPSFNRDEDDVERDYDFSCAIDGSCATIGDCSNTNHQARKICYQVDEEVVRTVVKTVSRWIEGVAEVIDTVAGWFGIDTEPVGRWVEEQVTELITEIMTIQVCVYDDSELHTDSKFFIPHGVPIFDTLNVSFFSRDFGLTIAKIFLNCKIPIVFGFKSVPSYKTRNLNNGFATYIGKKEKSKGGHCVLLTGYVDNKDLHTDAPKGAGGGYFIIKNSWDTSYGDCGYAYLPYDWVKQWGKYLVGIPFVGEK